MKQNPQKPHTNQNKQKHKQYGGSLIPLPHKITKKNLYFIFQGMVERIFFQYAFKSSGTL